MPVSGKVHEMANCAAVTKSEGAFFFGAKQCVCKAAACMGKQCLCGLPIEAKPVPAGIPETLMKSNCLPEQEFSGWAGGRCVAALFSLVSLSCGLCKCIHFTGNTMGRTWCEQKCKRGSGMLSQPLPGLHTGYTSVCSL